jgi:hypothetical protein
VPAFALGQHFLGGKQYERYPVDTLMAAALPSHLTFFSDLRELPDSVIAQARPWIDFYRRERDLLTEMTLPLGGDPLDKRWTALQSWDPEAGRGALLAFRQQDPDSSRRIALRDVPPRRCFALRAAPDGAPAGTATSAQLARGVRIDLPRPDTARVLVIEPSARATCKGSRPAGT